MNGAVVLNPSFSASAFSGSVDVADKSEGRVKSAMLVAAERIDRRTALISGYLRKKNSADKWQRRYFEIVGQYWVYYKTQDSSEMLCAMDLWKASPPALVAPASEDEGARCEFSITWDRYRVFRASTPQEAVRWVNAIQQVQAMRPDETMERPMTGPPTPMLAGLAKADDSAATKEAKEWGDRQNRRRGQGPQNPPPTEESEVGACGSCVIM